MHEAFLQDLAVVMVVAALVTMLFHRLKQPVVLGYILAGVIIGPHTPIPLIHDLGTIETLAELGIVFLMFSLGLEFNLRKLREVGVTALLAAMFEIVVMVGLGYELGRWFGWSVMDSLFLGAMLSVSSTTIIIKALGELGLARERFAGIIFGILIIEDILAIVMIALLSGIAMTGTMSLLDVGRTLGLLSVFLITTLVLGLIAVPRLLAFVARFHSHEMLLVTVLGLCFGFSLLAVKLGYSLALGAFVIGAVISESREIRKIEHLIEPVRDMFSAVFFVAIGLLIQPSLLWEHAMPIVLITLAVIVGKVVTCAFGTFLAGNDPKTSLRVGMGLAQIGEFSFIIASLGLSLKVTSGFLYPIAVAVSAITTLCTPYLIRSASPLVDWMDRVAPKVLMDYLGTYTAWVGRLGSTRKVSFAGQMVRKWSRQILLNLALIFAVFIVAGYVGTRGADRLPIPEALRKTAYFRPGLWLVAIVLALPLLIAIFRKLQALGLLVAEVKVPRAVAGEHTDVIRGIVSRSVPLAGLVGLVVLVLALSSPLLPPGNLLVVALIALPVLTWTLWTWAVRLHSKGQAALAATFSQSAVPLGETAPAKATTFLSDANLETVTVSEGWERVPVRIRDLGLRPKTGASIVGLERDGKTEINPDPDAELRVGDQVLLLGTPDQIRAACSFLEQKPAG
ncbi:MAG: cation:proton antiporter [Verrucomicrobiae bacterium]|nr:cation:proton antiporter [Verrucomicrobiae bacterium]